MGFFNELSSFLGDVNSLGEELKKPAEEARQSVSESVEGLTGIKDEFLNGLNPSDDKSDTT